MLNKIILSDKFNKLIVGQKDLFVEKANQIKDIICSSSLNNSKAVLLFGTDTREAVYYTFGIYYSLQRQRVLDYVVTTGQHFINQHFLSESTRDLDLYGKIYSSDILFVSLSQYDYTSDYLESLLIDLVDTRTTNDKLTIIYYDILSNKNYISMTQKLSDYFLASHTVIDLTKTNIKSPSKITKSTKTSERFI